VKHFVCPKMTKYGQEHYGESRLATVMALLSLADVLVERGMSVEDVQRMIDDTDADIDIEALAIALTPAEVLGSTKR
jgi:hypothetical protein